jgi:hypothetical protein
MPRIANTITAASFAKSRAKPAKPGKSQKPRPNRARPELSRAEALELIDAALEDPLPPRCAVIKREAPQGTCVCRWLLPLELCQPENRRRHQPKWRYGQIRDAMLVLLRAQWTAFGAKVEIPLGGIPTVRCIRFSSVEMDPGSGFEKQAVDCLLPTRWVAKRAGGPKHPVPGLALIWSDRGTKLRRIVYWHPWPRERPGCVLLELWR